jgi:hypothetical protein
MDATRGDNGLFIHCSSMISEPGLQRKHQSETLLDLIQESELIQFSIIQNCLLGDSIIVHI